MLALSRCQNSGDPIGTSESTCPELNFSFIPLQHTKLLSAHPVSAVDPAISLSLSLSAFSSPLAQLLPGLWQWSPNPAP